VSSRILITGASGFVGHAVFTQLQQQASMLPVAAVRTGQAALQSFRLCTDFNNVDQVAALVADIDCVVHCAARVHMMDEQAADPLAAFREVNTFGTLNLAKQAAAAGVKRFIFVSTIKVNGESTTLDKPFRADNTPQPEDPYGISKAEAEAGLMQIAKDSKMEVVIIRPPLVYGPGVKANFAAMLKLARKNLPLPLGAIHNKRSLVALDNLVDLIITCIDHPKAANQTFLVSDDQDVSTTELLQMMTVATGKKPWLLPVPASWLRFAAKLTGKQAVIDRLCGNLQVDIEHTRATLGWTPQVSVEEGIKRCFNLPPAPSLPKGGK
tara:strand:- start:1876 stop:2847 length:972 start_codon:yes stop_codon:yes gene_type:complete